MALFTISLKGLKLSTLYFYSAAGASTEINFTSGSAIGPNYPCKCDVFVEIGESANAEQTVANIISGSVGIDSFFLNGDIIS